MKSMLKKMKDSGMNGQVFNRESMMERMKELEGQLVNHATQALVINMSSGKAQNGAFLLVVLQIYVEGSPIRLFSFKNKQGLLH